MILYVKWEVMLNVVLNIIDNIMLHGLSISYLHFFLTLFTFFLATLVYLLTYLLSIDSTSMVHMQPTNALIETSHMNT